MAAPGSGPLGRGLDISLAALRRQDPYIQGIVDVASQVALYTFSHKANEWEKTDVEGTLFVYTRSASPKHGFTIMNRLSMENRTEPITKDLEFQLQDPFLLYRNARFLIYGIWFYNKEECQRLAELMKNLTQQEQLKAHQSATHVGVSPMNLHLDGNQVDILQMLTKAKDEYTKCKPCSEPKMMTSSSAIHTNPNLIKPIAVKPSDAAPQVTSGHQSKFAGPEPQHLSLTTLFGKVEKNPAEGADQQNSPSVRQTVVRSLSYEEATRSTDSCEKQLCPAIQKLMVRGADLHPVAEVPESQPCHNGAHIPAGDVFSSLFLPLEDTTPLSGQDHVCGGDYLLHKLQHSIVAPPDRGPPIMAQCASGKIMGGAPLNYYDASQENQRTPAPIAPAPLPSQPAPSTGAISPQEFLKKLTQVHQEQQLQMNPKPALAAKFPVISQGSPKPAWAEQLPLGEKSNPLLQIISPQRIPATVSPSLLLSPAVFTQTCASDAKNPPLPAKEPAPATANLLLPLSLQDTPSNQSSALTKSQLQGTLLHLIQNDENFLNTIYEAYMSVLNRGGAGRKF